MDKMKWIGCISITSDDNIPSCMCKSGFIGSPVSLSFLKEDCCSFTCGDVPCFILRISIYKNNLKIPVFVVEIVFVDCVYGFSDASFLIDCRNYDTDLQTYSLQDRV